MQRQQGAAAAAFHGSDCLLPPTHPSHFAAGGPRRGDAPELGRHILGDTHRTTEAIAVCVTVASELSPARFASPGLNGAHFVHAEGLAQVCEVEMVLRLKYDIVQINESERIIKQ